LAARHFLPHIPQKFTARNSSGKFKKEKFTVFLDVINRATPLRAGTRAVPHFGFKTFSCGGPQTPETMQTKRKAEQLQPPHPTVGRH
jgi:hypothetical protein